MNLRARGSKDRARHRHAERGRELLLFDGVRAKVAVLQLRELIEACGRLEKFALGVEDARVAHLVL